MPCGRTPLPTSEYSEEKEVRMFDRSKPEALLQETAREVVAEEFQALLFLKREASVHENRERKNGTYPCKLETPFG